MISQITTFLVISSSKLSSPAPTEASSSESSCDTPDPELCPLLWALQHRPMFHFDGSAHLDQGLLNQYHEC